MYQLVANPIQTTKHEKRKSNCGGQHVRRNDPIPCPLYVFLILSRCTTHTHYCYYCTRNYDPANLFHTMLYAHQAHYYYQCRKKTIATYTTGGTHLPLQHGETISVHTVHTTVFPHKGMPAHPFGHQHRHSTLLNNCDGRKHCMKQRWSRRSR